MRFEQKSFFRICFVFLMVLVGFLSLNVQKAHAQCGFNSIGDYICDQPTGASGSVPSMGGGPQNFLNNILPSIVSSSSCSGVSQISAIMTILPSSIQNAMMSQLISLLGGREDCDRINELLARLLSFQALISNLPVDPCGLISTVADSGRINLGAAFQAAAFNQIAQNISWSSAPLTVTIDGLIGNICGGAGGGGTPGETPDVDPLGKWCPDARAADYATDSSLPGTYNLTATDPRSRIAEAAALSVGATTRDVEATANGRRGCALAVSRILLCAGYPLLPGEIYLRTTEQDQALAADSCYERLFEGQNLDHTQLQPGDILMTPTIIGTSVVGHVGIYYGDNQIIDNISDDGAVGQGKSVEGWNQGVVSRNQSQSSVYRRRDSC
jgi:hypothetical protein